MALQNSINKKTADSRLDAIAAQPNPASTKNIQLDTNGSIIFADPGSGSTDWANPGTIGSTTPNTLKGTTLQLTSTAASASAAPGTAGALQCAGGISAAGNIVAGGYLSSAGDLVVDATGSSQGSPRVLGLVNLGTGTAAAFQFGDSSSRLFVANGSNMSLASYWGIDLYGARLGVTPPINSGSGSYNTSIWDLSGSTVPLRLQANTGVTKTSNYFEVRNASNTLITSIDSAGSISANALALSVALPISSGGTGSTSAAGALTALGAQALNTRLSSIAAQANPASVKNIQLNTDGSIGFADPGSGGSGSTDWASPGAIGSTTPNSGTFTTLSATSTTASTNTTTGSAVFAGGVGIAGDLNTGGKINSLKVASPRPGSVALGDTAGNSNTTGNNWTFLGYEAGKNSNTSGGVFLGYQSGLNEASNNRLHIANNSSESLIYGEFDNKVVQFNGKVIVTDTTASTSTTSGSARFAGGVGVAGAIYAGSLVLSSALSISSGGTGADTASAALINLGAQASNTRLSAIASQANPASVKNIQLNTDGTIGFADPAAGGGGGSDADKVDEVSFVSVTSSRALTLSDRGQFLGCDSTSAITITVPKDSTVNFAVGSFIEVSQINTGSVTIAAEDGTIFVRRLNSSATTNHVLLGRNASVYLKKVGANEWQIYGSIVESSIFAWDAIGSSIPSTTVEGYRWLELDGSGDPVEGWYWDNANTRWISTQVYTSQTFNVAMNATTAVVVSVPVSGSVSAGHVFLVSAHVRMRTATAHSGTLFYTLQPQWMNASGTATSIGSALNTQSLGANSFTDYTWSINTAYASPYFRLNYTRTSTPASIDTSTIFRFRRIR